MSIFNVKLRCKYLTVLKSDFRLNSAKLNEESRSKIFIILRLARFFMKFESKIAAFLDTHLLSRHTFTICLRRWNKAVDWL